MKVTFQDVITAGKIIEDFCNQQKDCRYCHLYDKNALGTELCAFFDIPNEWGVKDWMEAQNDD